MPPHHEDTATENGLDELHITFEALVKEHPELTLTRICFLLRRSSRSILALLSNMRSPIRIVEALVKEHLGAYSDEYACDLEDAYNLEDAYDLEDA